MLFQLIDAQNSQVLNSDTFYKPPLTSDQYIIGTDNCINAGITWNYPDDDYFDGYQEIEGAFWVQSKDDILQAYTSDLDQEDSFIHLGPL